jgi:hypothetical protein
MYSRVLFVTDLSKASDRALDCVAGWSSRTKLDSWRPTLACARRTARG